MTEMLTRRPELEPLSIPVQEVPELTEVPVHANNEEVPIERFSGFHAIVDKLGRQNVYGIDSETGKKVHVSRDEVLTYYGYENTPQPKLIEVGEQVDNDILPEVPVSVPRLSDEKKGLNPFGTREEFEGALNEYRVERNRHISSIKATKDSRENNSAEAAVAQAAEIARLEAQKAELEAARDALKATKGEQQTESETEADVAEVEQAEPIVDTTKKGLRARLGKMFTTASAELGKFRADPKEYFALENKEGMRNRRRLAAGVLGGVATIGTVYLLAKGMSAGNETVVAEAAGNGVTPAGGSEAFIGPVAPKGQTAIDIADAAKPSAVEALPTTPADLMVNNGDGITNMIMDYGHQSGVELTPDKAYDFYQKMVEANGTELLQGNKEYVMGNGDIGINAPGLAQFNLEVQHFLDELIKESAKK